MIQPFIMSRSFGKMYTSSGDEYLMEIEQFFGGKFRFQVNAIDSIDAIKTARLYIDRQPGERKDNYIMDSLRVVRKLEPSF